MKLTFNDFFKNEYGADVARLSNVFSEIKKPFEIAFFYVYCGDETTEHHHEEKEIFMCLKGEGKTYLDGNEFRIKPNDVWFANSGQKHKIVNDRDEVLTLISVWWDD